MLRDSFRQSTAGAILASVLFALTSLANAATPNLVEYTCVMRDNTSGRVSLIQGTAKTIDDSTKASFISRCSTIVSACTISGAKVTCTGMPVSALPPNLGRAFEAQPCITPPAAEDLGSLISVLFNWSLTILGIAVFSVITFNGFMWLTAAGDPGKISRARGHMWNAVLGAILLLSSYVILNTINPDLVKNSTNLPKVGSPCPAP